ncbi:hypothetical protein HMPREF1982_03527 [Clostridiales bacterium oral taxon 876 str. F0540]|nr:hypothetical protein HMPREF1982_03527 [Clostridiales bacterium oral taxon 876 str. F0540]
MLITQNNNTGRAVKEQVPRLEQQGQVLDIIADKIGMGSGRTYERAKNVSNKIEELKQNNNSKDAEFLKIMLNDSIRGTEDILKADCLDKISTELKDKVE